MQSVDGRETHMVPPTQTAHKNLHGDSNEPSCMILGGTTLTEISARRIPTAPMELEAETKAPNP
jgi:hypothetical protein